MQVKKINIIQASRLFMLLSLTIFSAVGHSQPPDGNGPPPGSNKISVEEIAGTQTNWMKKKLDLTKEQVTEVNKINLSYAAKLQAEQNNTGQNTNNTKPVADNKGGTQAGKLAELDKEKDIALKAVLTEKQFSIYLKKKSVLNNSLGNGEMPPPPPPGGF